jgi:N-acyl-D-amino-acid deacylase
MTRKYDLPVRSLITVLLFFLWLSSSTEGAEELDLLLKNGRVLDAAGNPWFGRDIGIRGDRIVFVGNAEVAEVSARETLDVGGLLVAPGFWDVHSHADLLSEHGRAALPQLYQGITTIVLGMDGRGTSEVAETFRRYDANGIGVNAIHYVGHNAAREAVLGREDRAPTAEEMERMKAFVEKGMKEGAVGLSTGLYYTPGTFATTDEVVELAKVAARYGGSYDTHDRDLGVAYPGIGYLASIREGIEIGERAGTPVIFSHFNAQGPHNYGRAVEGARLIDEARARGVNVMAGQHVYMASGCSLVACVLPRWVAADGTDEMRKRLLDPALRERITREITDMVALVGGPEKLVFTDPSPELVNRTLGDVARAWNLPVPETVMKILQTSNGSVLNRDIYDPVNTDFLARQEWMMTCTDGGTPVFGEGVVHPRTYGAFTRKLRDFVLDRGVVSLPFAVRGMTSLPASFYGMSHRGLIREGFYADLVVLDLDRIRDLATYEEPHKYSEGTVHVIVNGKLAFKNGRPTGALAGRPLPREAAATTRE